MTVRFTFLGPSRQNSAPDVSLYLLLYFEVTHIPPHLSTTRVSLLRKRPTHAPMIAFQPHTATCRSSHALMIMTPT